MSAPELPVELDRKDLALETRGLARRFAPAGRPLVQALDGLDLQVPAGAVYVLAGPNGAGKSTALAVLLGLVRADAGEARVVGIDPARQGAQARAHIGYVPEGTETGYGWLTVREFLSHRSVFYPAWDRGYEEWLVGSLELPPESLVRSLSKGMARRLVLVSALAHRPPVLLLDEPTDGLDPLAREDFASLLVDHVASSETTILWCTHHVQEAERLADHVGVIHRGRLLLQAPLDVVRARVRRYRARVPQEWSASAALNGEVLVREQEGCEIAWTVWGEERDVAERLAASGAVVTDATPLGLHESAVALLRAGRGQ